MRSRTNATRIPLTYGAAVDAGRRLRLAAAVPPVPRRRVREPAAAARLEREDRVRLRAPHVSVERLGLPLRGRLDARRLALDHRLSALGPARGAGHPPLEPHSRALRRAA